MVSSRQHTTYLATRVLHDAHGARHCCKKQGHLARMAKRTQGTAAGQFGILMGESSRSKRTHWKVKRAVREVNNKHTPYFLCLWTLNEPTRLEVSVTVDGVPMTMELNTRAAVSVIREHTYHSTWPHDRSALQPSSIKLRTYSGEELEVCYEDHAAGGTTPF